MDWVRDNWVAISIALYATINVLQVATRHFGEYRGFKKVALFLIDILSVFGSRGQAGALKLPGKPSKEGSGEEKG